MSLVLTRREGEEVVLGGSGGEIGRVRVADIKGDRVRLAFDFPTKVAVHRSEVWDAIQAEQAAAELGAKAGSAAA